jgi:hypothetical protein
MDGVVWEVVGIEVGVVSGVLNPQVIQRRKVGRGGRTMPTTTMNTDADHRVAEATDGLSTIGLIRSKPA